MTAMTTRTNNQARPVLYWYELTDAERAELDYTDADHTDDFRGFRYKGQAYDLGEFTAITRMSQASPPSACHGVSDDSPLVKWHGIQTDTYFSGVVVRYTSDFESVVVGQVFS